MSRFTWMELAAAAVLFPLCGLGAAQVPVTSEISDVTVYGRGAIVTRSVEAMASDGTYLVRDLPGNLDAQSLRVRALGAEVVGVDTLLRYRERADDAERAALRAAVELAEANLAARADDVVVSEAALTFAEKLAASARAAMRRELSLGMGTASDWRARADFLRAHSKAAEARRVDAEAQKTEAWKVLQEARERLGASNQDQGRPTYDVVIDLAALAGAAPVSSLVLEYFVPEAGWAPTYDLRAASSLKDVELVYRASVWQTTGEDWLDVPLTLSTARPELGASGPAPRATWIGVRDPRQIDAGFVADSAVLEKLGYLGASLEASEMELEEEAWAPSFAGVDDSGLAVRFRLPRNETVESRNEPSVLSVGRANLTMELEHYAVPSKSELVWMRGLAVNTSAWNMLPGRAAVYVGGDFVGHASLSAVPAGTDFELPLGPDRGMAIARVKVDDLSGGSGILRSRSTDLEGWRLTLSNFGGAGAAPDGSVRVIVQEVLPKSQDERLKIELGDVVPALSKAERFQRDREEKGILTWEITVPKGSEREVRWTRELVWPKDLRVRGS